MINIWLFLGIQFGLIIGGIIFWLIRSLIIKNKNYEKALLERDEIIRKQTEYLLSIYEAVNLAEKKIIEIDTAQIFQSDDEIGWYFSLLKQIQKQLFEYTKYIK